MSRSTIVRSLAVLILCLNLATPWASAAPVRSEEEPVAGSFAGWLWEVVRGWWEKAGCQVDPNGRCIEGEKAGCQADPFGRCIEGEKAGCVVDPYGRCIG